MEQRPDTKGKQRFYVRKSYASGSGISFATEFSAAGWNKATLEYLGSVKLLGAERLQVIFDEIKDIQMNQEDEEMEVDGYSGRANLCSD
jgi:hypothetical protein